MKMLENSPPHQSCCLSCDRQAHHPFGICSTCYGLMFNIYQKGEYSLLVPEIAASSFRQDVLELCRRLFPTFDEKNLNNQLKKGTFVLCEGLPLYLATALKNRFKQIPITLQIIQTKPNKGLLKALKHPITLSVAAIVGIGAYAMFPAFLAIDLGGTGLIGLSTAALLAFRSQEAAIRNLPTQDLEIEWTTSIANIQQNLSKLDGYFKTELVKQLLILEKSYLLFYKERSFSMLISADLSFLLQEFIESLLIFSQEGEKNLYWQELSKANEHTYAELLKTEQAQDFQNFHNALQKELEHLKESRQALKSL